MSVFEEIFHPEAADARKSREAEKTLPAPAPAAAPPPILTDDGTEILIPPIGDAEVD